MPIYMDRHDLPGVTAKDVAAAHQEDLKIQDLYGCRALTYWFDEERQMAFCLIEAPDKNAVKEMHDKAHGLVPHQLLEVDFHIVEAFLGRIKDPENADKTDDGFSVFHEPALRALLATTQRTPACLQSPRSAGEPGQLAGIYNGLIRKALHQYGGREVQHREDCFLASFVSVSNAVLCALEIRKNIEQHNSTKPLQELDVQIGLSAGVPVHDSQEFFGKALQLAKRLSTIPSERPIVASPMVRDLYKQGEVPPFDQEEAIKTLNLPEEKFLTQLLDITEACWSEPEFSIRDLAQQMGVSKSQLYRKILSLTGSSPNDFIKEFRLNKAISLIRNHEGNISEVAYQSGFSSPSYFTKCFQKKFGILPSGFAMLQ